MVKQHPLDIPELLSIIASFVSVWEVGEPRNNSCSSKLFNPRDILACTLVNKLWRQEMLPHLWAVYSPDHMAKIPVDIIFQNSIHFRHFDPKSETRHNGFVPTLRQLWQNDSSGKSLHQKCTALKTFVLVPQALDRQFELLRANRSLVSLEWMWTEPQDSDMRETIQSMAKSLSWFLKELCLRQGTISSHDPVLLLRIFSRLERLNLKSACKPLLQDPLTEMTRSDGVVRIDTLKYLTIFDEINRNNSMSCPVMYSSGEGAKIWWYSPAMS
ncbi:hypothetical protein BGZ82_000117 [Podila clonocystis]|nr:hypothetical protein BGZ82_000117 [Podila clonocystis]